MANNAATDETLLLTDGEVARHLRFGLTKTRAMIRTGEIPSMKIGGHRRVARADLESYVNDLRARSVTAE